MRCGRKSENISFDGPATAWQVTHLAFSKKSSAPRFCPDVIARVSPRANRSSGASAAVSVVWNSAIASRRMWMVIPPGDNGTPPLNTAPNFSR